MIGDQIFSRARNFVVITEADIFVDINVCGIPFQQLYIEHGLNIRA